MTNEIQIVLILLMIIFVTLLLSLCYLIGKHKENKFQIKKLESKVEMLELWLKI